MKSLVGGLALLLLSGFMFWGFLRSGTGLGSPNAIIALLITVALPAVAGGTLLARRVGAGRRIADRKLQLREQTLEAEILRLAGQHDGKLTVVEVVRDLAVTPEAAEKALNAMHTRELAEIEITDSGVLVYAFRDVQRLTDKSGSRALLDG